MLNCTRPFKFHKWSNWEVTATGELYDKKVSLRTGQTLSRDTTGTLKSWIGNAQTAISSRKRWLRQS